jgi:glucosamine-6-phosphate deaminase
LWTLSALQTHPWALIVVDEDATAGKETCAWQRGVLMTITPELRVKTVKYFKSIERVHEEVEASKGKLAKKDGAELNGSRSWV